MTGRRAALRVRLSSVVRGLALTAFFALAPNRSAVAQERGAPALDQLVRGLTVTARVLVVGAHPDDEDTQLIAWLSRGRGVETAYLSLTRGDGGQNFIGNELGEALGAIRTGELLAARREDGGRQFFTRAYDFGFSKSAEETYKHWDHDTLLADVVTVIRAFRPHVIVTVFSGTPSDGHGHHQVAGLLAREAYDASLDTVRFPPGRHGQPWEALKFYRSVRFGRGQGGVATPATLVMNVGEFDPVLGRSYAEIADESRAQHRSQGFAAAPQRRGVRLDALARLASRVNEAVPPADERSLFDGVDTSFARLARAAPPAAREALEQLAPLADSARATLDLRRPASVVRWLARAAELAETARAGARRCTPPRRAERAADRAAPLCDAATMDLDASLGPLRRRTADAALSAAGVAAEATAPQELLAFGDSMPVTLAVYNRGREPVTLLGARLNVSLRVETAPLTIAPDSSARVTRHVIGLVDSRPWWLGRRGGDLFPARQSPADGLARVSEGRDLAVVPGVAVSEEARRESDVEIALEIAGARFTTSIGPIVNRFADPALGEQYRPVGGVPAVTLAFDRGLEWMPAGKPIDRYIRLSLRSWSSAPRTLTFRVVSPPGIRVDSVPASLTLQAKEQKELFLRVRGSLAPGRQEFGVIARTPDGSYYEGITAIEYPHIRPIRFYRTSGIWLAGVTIEVPKALRVAYVQGVGDEVAAYLPQLGVSTIVIAPATLPLWDLSQFTTVVVGPRAYQAHRELLAYNARLLDFARKGGTVVVQYGQQEMTTPGLLPYPIQRNSQRVTVEEAPVAVLDRRARVLTWPNRVDSTDWAGWVQERSLYMPTVIDPRWATPLELHDPDEPENRGALLVAPVGKGMYVYTTLALFRQIPGGVPGGPRLFVNLLSAGLGPSASGRAAPSKPIP